MQSVAWSCRGCGALVEPHLRHCHRCGGRRDSATPDEEAPEAGTPAEFITAVYRSSIEPMPPHGPIDETMPAETELVKERRSGTIPEAPILVPPPRAPIAPPPENEPRPRWSAARWVLVLLVPTAIILAVIAYLQIDEARDFVDGIVDSVAR